ncbi:MAG: hypothetical protein OXI38_06220, partial [Bacteroidota bacterium]|nr:hypothetical protein [Bacteroidota bacterium]
MPGLGVIRLKICPGKAVLMLGLTAICLAAVALGQKVPRIIVAPPALTLPSFAEGNSWYILKGTSVTVNVKPDPNDQNTQDFRSNGGFRLLLPGSTDLGVSYKPSQAVIDQSNWTEGVDIMINIGADSDNTGGCQGLLIEMDPINLTAGFSGSTYPLPGSVSTNICVIANEAGIVAFPGIDVPVAMTDGGMEAIDVMPMAQPVANVEIVGISGRSGTDIPPSLSVGNQSMPQPMSAVTDTDFDDEGGALTLAAKGKKAGGELVVSPTTLTVYEGSCNEAGPNRGRRGTGTFSIGLTEAPTYRWGWMFIGWQAFNHSNVYIAGSFNRYFKQSGELLTPTEWFLIPIPGIPVGYYFGDDWQVNTEVSICGEDNAAGETREIKLVPWLGNYRYASAVNVEVNVVAEPPQEIVLSTSDLGVDEGATADYTVKLAAQPTTDVTVAITVHSFIAGRSVPAVTTSPTSLTFTAANYNTEQTVTVLAAQDNNAINDRATLVHTASGGDYEGQTASLKVTVDDDDAGIVLSRSEQAVSEGGSSTHRVKLSTQPSGDVTVDITGHVGTDLTLDMESLTFTTVNYNTAQTVTVTAGQDDDAAFDTATLLHTASGGGYAGLTASLPVTTIDDETAEITISESTLGVSEGSSKTYTVKLATPPTVPVTVAITGQAGTDLMLDKTSLTFNPSGSDLWSTAQTVTVTAGQDDDAADDLVTLVHTASGGEYSEITASLPVTVDDDETARIVLSASTLRVDEGSNNTYTVKLATQPTADVTVRISGHSGTDLSLDVESLIFTTANYNTAQTVMVSAGSDSDADDDLVALEHRARGGDYQNLRSTIDVTVNDVTKAIVVNPMDLPVDEGSDA